MPAAESTIDGNRGFRRDVFRLASGTVMAQIIAVALTPLLTRLFPPSAYGMLAVFIALTSMLGVIACLRYEVAIVLPERDTEAAHLLAVCLIAATLLGAATWPLVMLGREALPRWIDSTDLSGYLWMIPFAVAVNGWFLALTAWETRARRYGRLAYNRVIQTLGIQLPKVALGWAGHPTGGVLIGSTVCGQGLATAILSAQAWRSDKALFAERLAWRDLWGSMKRYRKFPLVDLWGSLMNNISWQLPPLLLAVCFAPAVAGHYALSFRLLHMPMALIGVSVGQVFYRQVSAVRADPPQLRKATESVFHTLLAWSLFPVLLLAVVGKDVFIVAFGSRWAEAGVYAQILSPWIGCWFISSPLSTLFSALERQGQALFVHAAIFLSRLAALLIGGYFGNVYLALGLFSASGVVVYGMLAALNLKLAGVNPTTALKALFVQMSYALPGALILLALKGFGMSPLALTGVAGLELLVFIAIRIRLDPNLRHQMRSVFRAQDASRGP